MRAAIYAQAIFSTTPALVDLTLIFILADHYKVNGMIPPSEDLGESNTVKGGMTLFFTGCALLLSTVIEARSHGLSVYHAVIVLNLSWLNCYCGLIAFLGSGFQSARIADNPTFKEVRPIILLTSLTVIQYAGAGGIGIWLWRDVLQFNNQPECTSVTAMAMFGKKVLVIDKGLRTFWLVIYSAALYGAGGMVLTGIVAGFLTMREKEKVMRNAEEEAEDAEAEDVDADDRELVDRMRYMEKRVFIPLFAVCGTFFITTMVVCTELTIWFNRDHVDYEAEASWTFGQTLALFLAGITGEGAVEELWRGVKRWRAMKRSYLTNLSLMGHDEGAHELTSLIGASYPSGPPPCGERFHSTMSL